MPLCNVRWSVYRGWCARWLNKVRQWHPPDTYDGIQMRFYARMIVNYICSGTRYELINALYLLERLSDLHYEPRYEAIDFIKPRLEQLEREGRARL